MKSPATAYAERYELRLLKEASAKRLELSNLHCYHGNLVGVLNLIAMPKRSDGTYNRSREACGELALEAVKRWGKLPTTSERTE